MLTSQYNVGEITDYNVWFNCQKEAKDTKGTHKSKHSDNAMPKIRKKNTIQII